jgi:hypothetical protein
MIKTIENIDFRIEKTDYDYEYQSELTNKLDFINSDFSQEIINEIVLWKINRYAKLSSETIELINQIPNADFIDKNLTINILKSLLNTKGVQLPMASTILRFKNPMIYQIIDQRVYRILYGKELSLSNSKSDKRIVENIDLYIRYLDDLRLACSKIRIPFDQADRILYETDKRINSKIKLKNYG